MTKPTPIYRSEDNELLGFVSSDGTSWQALTLFGYLIARTVTRKDAKATLEREGLTYLSGIWQYYDKDDREWVPCVIAEAYEHKVIIHRANSLGYLDPHDYKRVVIESPSENTLIKVS